MLLGKVGWRLPVLGAWCTGLNTHDLTSHEFSPSTDRIIFHSEYRSLRCMAMWHRLIHLRTSQVHVLNRCTHLASAVSFRAFTFHETKLCQQQRDSGKVLP